MGWLVGIRLTSPTVEAYVFRGARLWLLTRAVLALAFLLVGSNPLQLSAVAIFGVILLSVLVSFLDTHRHGERALLGNLGVSAPVLAFLFAAPAIVGEVALWLVAAAIL